MSEKDWLPVESTALKAVRYNHKYKWLDVHLCSGRMYRYENVKFTEYSELLSGGQSGSIGREFNNIKLRHEGEVHELTATL